MAIRELYPNHTKPYQAKIIDRMQFVAESRNKRYLVHLRAETEDRCRVRLGMLN